jgi:shikimate dehydrogenase
MHNAAFLACGLDSKFVFAAARVRESDLAPAISGLRALDVQGVSCTQPHKVSVMRFLDEIDNDAKEVGAVNTVVNRDGRLCGYNTDLLGVTLPLKKRTALRGKKVALIGAGGAARAALFGLRKECAEVTVFNRSEERGRALADAAGCVFRPLSEFGACSGFEIIVNTTSLGMNPHPEETPLAAEQIHAGQIVFDAVYAPYQTRLLKEARSRGAEVVHGTEMFVAQGAAQFELYTGMPAPIGVMEQALHLHLGIKT